MLLSQDCLTYAEIARRLGVSSERVRQLGHLVNKTGRERLGVCRVNKKKAHIYSAPLIQKTAKECERRGFTFEPLDRRSAIINGKRCLIRRCWEVVKKRRKYVRVHPPRRMDGDYLILWIGDLAFVFPKSQVPKETIFSLNPLPTGPSTARRDYADYLDAWILLIRKTDAKKRKVA